jgi:hypothetical protein
MKLGGRMSEHHIPLLIDGDRHWCPTSYAVKPTTSSICFSCGRGSNGSHCNQLHMGDIPAHLSAVRENWPAIRADFCRSLYLEPSNLP